MKFKQQLTLKPLKSIYLDVCAFSRPFDDQGYLRIKLETDAVNLILSKVRQGKFRVLVSPVHVKEIENISDLVERIELQTILATLGQPVTADKDKAYNRAEELVKLGFGLADAAHVSFAEQSGAAFISVDDKLIKKCLKHKIQVWCGNPVAFCEEDKIR